MSALPTSLQSVKRPGLLLPVVVAPLVLGGWFLLGEPSVSQPIEFPHRAHLELKEPKLTCTSCHERAEREVVAGRPSTRKCLACHEKDEKPTPPILKLLEFGKAEREIPWKRVWRLPPDTFFSHRLHVAAKIECQRCHGPMQTLDRPPAHALKKLRMADCIDCHERWQWSPEAQAKAAGSPAVVARAVSTDCNSCHR